MNPVEILKTMAESFHSSASVKTLFGEPVTTAGRTVLPVARVQYAFGGGGGGKRYPEHSNSEGGGGGGGHVSAVPVGYVEITGTGSRFVPIPDWRRFAAVAGVGLAVGFWLGARRRW